MVIDEVKKVLNFALNREILRKKFIGIYMVYFGWYLVNPHAQRVQNMYGKRGRGYLRPSYKRPMLTLISRFVAIELLCHKKLTLLYFCSDHLETNRTWVPIR